jgi:hypothetical protein
MLRIEKKTSIFTWSLSLEQSDAAFDFIDMGHTQTMLTNLSTLQIPFAGIVWALSAELTSRTSVILQCRSVSFYAAVVRICLTWCNFFKSVFEQNQLPSWFSMPSKAKKTKQKPAKTAGESTAKETEQIQTSTPQEILELVTARKKLERALQVTILDRTSVWW